MFSKAELRRIYQDRAPSYDRWVSLYPLVGINVPRHRVETVRSLRLRPGDTVVELGCGTGLNFPALVGAVGREGRVIGVDLTRAMLGRAQRRIASEGWRNVELVEADAATFGFPREVGGVVSMFALTLVAEYDAVISRASGALRPGGRLAIFDLKAPQGWPRWLVRSAAWLNRPFGVTIDLAERHPWESVRRYLDMVEFREFSAGMLYRAVGERIT